MTEPPGFCDFFISYTLFYSSISFVCVCMYVWIPDGNGAKRKLARGNLTGQLVVGEVMDKPLASSV